MLEDGRVCVVITNRAPYGRLKSVMQAIKKHPRLHLSVIVGASALLDRWGCVDVIERDGFKIDERIYSVLDGDVPQTMAQTTGLLSIQLASSFDRLKPDIVLAHADRYEQLAVAYTAAYMNIPVAHNQGGEVTGSIDDKVRDSITALADLHFTATEGAMRRVKSMGHSLVYNVGCPGIDLLQDLGLPANVKGVGAEIDFAKPFLTVVFHPVTTEYGQSDRQVKEVIAAVKRLDIPAVWFWPNLDSGNDAISQEIRRWREKESPNVRFVKNLPPEEYAKVLAHTACLIGNTSSGIREGSYLGTPYVCIGTRQEGREHGDNVLFVPCSLDAIVDAVRQTNGRHAPSTLYGDGHAGEKIAAEVALWSGCC